MKYLIVIEDGASDYPLKELSGKTPLMAANKPNLDKLAKEGRIGLTQNVPKSLSPGSDVANMSIFGYNPLDYYTGRGPIEAASMGLETKEGDVVFRCNTIMEADGKIADFNAGHITTEESAILLNDLNSYFKDKYPDFKGTFYPGISYRHLFVYNNSETNDLVTMPPHDIVDEDIEQYTSWDSDAGLIIKNIMEESKEFLKNHEINKKRADNGQKVANMVWLWGQGVMPDMPDLKDVYGLNASTITGVDLFNGLGVCSGCNTIEVPGATGFFDTDYEAKGKYAIEALKDSDLVFVHIEAPDEAGHAGDIEEKIKAIESIDKYILGPLMEAIKEYGDYKIAVLPDHPTPIDIRTHTRDKVPVVIYDSNGEADDVEVYDEDSASKGSLGEIEGYTLLSLLLDNN